MASKVNYITAYQNPQAGNPAAPGLNVPGGAVVGFMPFTNRGTIKRAADGTALAAAPAIDAINSIFKSVTRNGAGDYTVVLNDDGQTAAQVAPRLTLCTAGLYGTVVVTDATHLAVATKTDAGVATDSIFCLSVDILNLP